MGTARKSFNPARKLISQGCLIASACSAAAMLTIAAPAPASAAAARPASGTACVNTLADDPPMLCLHVTGTGTYVNNMRIAIDSGYTKGKFRITGPRHQSYFSKVMNVQGGKSYEFAFNRHVPAGDYWGYFWSENPNGTFTATAGAHLIVHP